MRLVIVVFIAALISGCGVSKEVLQKTEKALAACKDSSALCEKNLDATKGELEDVRSNLESEKSRVSKLENDLANERKAIAQRDNAVKESTRELNFCREQTEAAQNDVEALKTHSQQLKKRLEKEIEDKNVQIQLLENKLAVQVLTGILFNSGSVEILKEGKAVLDKIAPNLVSGKEMIRIEGHTDHIPIGPKIKNKWFSNWELSASRAANVVRYYQYAHHIAPARMEAVGLSAFHPTSDNETTQGRQDNRRVVIILTAVK